MLCIVDSTTDPYWNLAAEEYLLTSLSEPVFRLWRNAPSVIVGRYQNAAAEINSEYVRTRGIPVVRRLTGGGAVFHDLGNVNYTFIDRKVEGEDTAAMFRRFTAPVISALRSLGVEASLEGRNDLVISGRKFSGNAVCVHGGRVLQHGTLLFSASVADLSGALNTRPEKFIGKSVQSNARGSPTSRSICPPGTAPCQWRSSSLIFRIILQAVRTLSAATPHRRRRP